MRAVELELQHTRSRGYMEGYGGFLSRLLGRLLGYLIFSLMALIGDPIY